MIQNVEHLFKEMAEAVLRRSRRLMSGLVPEKVQSRLLEFRSRGFAVVEDFWPRHACAEAVTQIEEALISDTKCHRWVDAEGSDRRLYYAERVGGRLAEYHASPMIENFRRYYTGVARADTLLLAAKLTYVAGNKGSGGGWHRDSPHRSQFKAILYLSDVAVENGPFEYLERSHGVTQSLRLLFNGRSRPNQYRFSDDEIAELCNDGAVKRTFTAPAGTLLLIDSKGIHRGSPIQVGSRFALTQYCFDGAIPPNFLA